MVASLSNKQAKAADGTSFPLALLDKTGDATGPYLAVHAVADTAGALISPATVESVEAATSALGTVHADLVAILAKQPAAPALDATVAASNAALGAPADAAWTSGSGSIVSLLKRLSALLSGSLTVGLPSGASTAANQTTGNTSLASIDTKLGSSLPLPSGAATSANQSTANAAIGAPADTAWLSGSGSIIAVLKGIFGKLSGVVLATGTASIGKVGLQITGSDVAYSNPVPIDLPLSQDPIFDNTNGTKTSVTTSALIITPPAGCKFIRIATDVNIFVNASNAAAVDDGTSILIFANQPEVIPVTPGIIVRALSSSGTATVRCMPLKAR